MANTNIRQLPLYQVEFTRIDEQQTVSYLIAVAPGQTEVQAIEKGEALFADYSKENGDLVLFSFNDVRDNEKRRNADPLKTYWRNRCAPAGEAFF